MKQILLAGMIFIISAQAAAQASAQASAQVLVQISAQSSVLEQNAFPFNWQRFNLLAHSHQRMDSLLNQQAEVRQKKSVFLAALYSGVVPGAGELYGGSYWKAALFFGLEVAGWTTYMVYDHKGDVSDKNMRAYADKNWNEQRYRSKLYYEAQQKGIPNLPDYELQQVDNGYILTDYGPEVVNSLRFLENQPQYTHKLPATKTQQYYEMIYKYLAQFGNGWQDADFYLTYSGYENIMTPMMIDYRDMRNDMNHNYNIASSSLNVVLINHVLSALDAALTTRKYNRTLAASFRVQDVQYYGEKVYVYALQLSW